jgi:DNA-directed RNA polymerase specialized sigma24 family protein
MSSADLYSELRPRAFAIAYQMLGSVSEAEDVVQEAFLRMHMTLGKQEQIASPRARRERYVGEWLPEPLLTDPTPADKAETADSLSLALLVVLETLSPQQRAAFLLREVFDYPYGQVADIISSDVDTARHLVAKARAHVQQRRPRYYASRQQQEDLAQRFFAATEHGDLQALETLLAQDVVLHGDGGGKVPALGRAVNGRERVARLLLTSMAVVAPFGGIRVKAATVNGMPGALVLDSQGLLFGVLALDIADGEIQAIHSIVNPDKLRHLAEVSDLGAQIRADRQRRNG